MSIREIIDARRAGLPPPCMETEPHPGTITIHASNDETWVFPWSRFAWSHIRAGELVMSFADREIVVRGTRLDRVGEKIMACEVEVLRSIDPHFAELLDGQAAAIFEIKVRQT